MNKLVESSAHSVFKNFERISAVPRCSNNEDRISEFMFNFGKELGLDTTKDEFGNVLIKKPATKGFENKDTVVLQSHIDMVCEKTETSNHDFTCDPIELLVDGDFIHANETTLGADDGIGVALVMAILESNEISHPRIEAIFTTTEETGMDGAIGLSEKMLSGKHLINIDNEEDWMIIVGCAGGIGATLEKKISKKILENVSNYNIKVSGLQGGHSGTMIGESRLNAIKILNSLLLRLRSDLNIHLSEINGGTKHNAIPSLASSIIGVDLELEKKLMDIFNAISIEYKEKYLKREFDLEITIEKVDNQYDYIEEESAKNILNVLELFPHGVNTMDKDLDIVRSSNNLAIVRTEESFKIHTSIRSSHPGDMKELKNKVKDIASNFEFEINFSDGYPMWEPNFDNHLLETAKESYRQLKKSEAEVAVIHAGLETGILSKKYPNTNMISIGPNILGAHTPKERLSISSTEFCFEYLKHIIKNL